MTSTWAVSQASSPRWFKAHAGLIQGSTPGMWLIPVIYDLFKPQLINKSYIPPQIHVISHCAPGPTGAVSASPNGTWLDKPRRTWGWTWKIWKLLKTAVAAKVGANPDCQSLQTIVAFFLWLISLCSEACFAASNMPERHQEAFFLRIPCHVSLEAQKTRLGQILCREPHNAPTYLFTTVPKLSKPCEPIVCYCNVRKCNVV